MKLTADYWIKYINIHTSANKAAKRQMEAYIARHGTDDMGKLSDYAFALVTKYGEAATALSCEMYDKLARAQKADVPDAMPAETATYGEVAKAVRGAAKRSTTLIPDVVGRLVKQAGADTTLQNAKRDGAYFAWVSHGDTCPYCMALAGLGWRKAGELTLKGGHAEHIHANCDCEYVIDFKGNLEIEGYYPDKINQQLLDMTDGEYDAESLIRMSGHNAKGHDHSALNIVRRKQYAANPEKYRAQSRAAYAARKQSPQSLIREAKAQYLRPAELKEISKNDIINNIKSHEALRDFINSLGIRADASIDNIDLETGKHFVAGVAEIQNDFPKTQIRRILVNSAEGEFGSFGYDSLYMTISSTELKGRIEYAFPAGAHEAGHAVDRLLSMAIHNKKEGYAKGVVQKAIANLGLTGDKEILERIYLTGGFEIINDNNEVFAGAFERLARKKHTQLSEEIIRIVRSDYDALYS